MPFPVLSGSTAVNVFEGFSEVAVGDKAALLCDRGNAVIGALQPHCSHLGAVFDEEADRRAADGPLKAPGALTQADPGSAGDLLETQGM